MRFRLPRRTNQVILGWIKIVIIAILAEFFILYLLGQFDSLKLLDYSLIVSLVVVEVPIGVFLYYILGERRRARMHEALTRGELVNEYRHLRIHYFKFPLILNLVYLYVENVPKKQAYNAPDYLWELGNWGILHKIRHKNEKEMLDYFKKNDIAFEAKDAMPNELLP